MATAQQPRSRSEVPSELLAKARVGPGIPFVELVLQPGEGGELRGAHRSKVCN